MLLIILFLLTGVGILTVLGSDKNKQAMDEYCSLECKQQRKVYCC